MEIDQLKRKLRELKKLEKRIRFIYASMSSNNNYIWDEYFSTKSINDLTVKYPLWKLSRFTKEELKEVYEEFFYSVYFQKFKEEGFKIDNIYDVDILSVFQLTPGASIEDIKKKFRELAKKYHPDHGGESNKMIELLNAYHKLIDKG